MKGLLTRAQTGDSPHMASSEQRRIVTTDGVVLNPGFPARRGEDLEIFLAHHAASAPAGSRVGFQRLEEQVWVDVDEPWIDADEARALNGDRSILDT